MDISSSAGHRRHEAFARPAEETGRRRRRAARVVPAAALIAALGVGGAVAAQVALDDDPPSTPRSQILSTTDGARCFGQSRVTLQGSGPRALEAYRVARERLAKLDLNEIDPDVALRDAQEQGLIDAADTPDQQLNVAIQLTVTDLLGDTVECEGLPRTAIGLGADLLGDLFVVVWRRRVDLPSDPEQQRRWLFTVAGHVMANHRRGTARSRGLAERLRRHLATSPSATGDDQADVLTVRDAVRRLPDDQRELVMLVHWDGFTVAGAAAVLEVNPSTARSRYSAARERLRAELVDEPGGPLEKPVRPARGGTRG